MFAPCFSPFLVRPTRWHTVSPHFPCAGQLLPTSMPPFQRQVSRYILLVKRWFTDEHFTPTLSCREGSVRRNGAWLQVPSCLKPSYTTCVAQTMSIIKGSPPTCLKRERERQESQTTYVLTCHLRTSGCVARPPPAWRAASLTQGIA